MYHFSSSFIGELFKTQMLTAPIMYDCVDYLLRDKTDEEGLECLCRLLNTIGRELDEKAGEKVGAVRVLRSRSSVVVFSQQLVLLWRRTIAIWQAFRHRLKCHHAFDS